MTLYNRQAFTLIELLISMSILASVMILVSNSLDMSTRMNDRVTRQTDINNRANDVLNKLALQLRMANGVSTSLQLPGPYPIGFVPSNPANGGNVAAYYYAVSTGLSGAPNWDEQYEPFQRVIIYDYSDTPGRLILRTRDNAGVWQPEQPLTGNVAPNGFSLSRIGNTLQMALTLRSETRAGEEIIYTAQAQTLFLRSTLNESSGSSAVTYVDNPEDADGNIAGTTTNAPAIMFGNLVTEISTSQHQVSLFFTAPIGQKVNPSEIIVTLGNSDNTQSANVPEGGSVTVGSATVMRQTFPPQDQWPSRNGTYSVTLTGSIPSTVTITATAVNAAGVAATESKRYR